MVVVVVVVFDTYDITLGDELSSVVLRDDRLEHLVTDRGEDLSSILATHLQKDLAELRLLRSV